MIEVTENTVIVTVSNTGPQGPSGIGVQYKEGEELGSQPDGTLAMGFKTADALEPLEQYENSATGHRLNPYGALWIALSDSEGNQVSSFGGGTQYEAGTTEADPIGNVFLWSDTGNVLKSVSDSDPLPVNVVSGDIEVTVGDVTVNNGAGAAAVNIQDGGNTITVDGTVGATQSGNWNVGQVGTWNINLPTGAATAAKQPALGTAGTPSTDVITVQGRSGMTPLLVNGSGVTQPVSGTVTIQDGGNTITVDGTVGATQSGAWNVGQTGTWTVQPGNTANTTPWLTSLNAGGVTASILDLTNNNPLTVAIVDTSGDQIASFGGGTQYTNGASETDPVGTVAMWWDNDGEEVNAVSTANPLPVNVVAGDISISSVTVDNGSGASAVNIQDGGNSITVDDGGSSITIDGTVAATQSGNWDIRNITGTIQLPSGAATSAKQPALGTAGTASSDVITVQGIAAMTPLLVNGSGVTQPVSGTVTVQDGGSSITVDNGGTFAVQAAQSGTWNIGSITTLPALAAGSNVIGGVTQSGTWNIGSITTLPALAAGSNIIGSLTANQTVNVAQINGVTPLMGNGTTGTGSLRVTLASDTTANTNPFLIVGNVANDAVDSGNPLKIGGVARTSNPTAVANGDRVDGFFDDVGRKIVVLNQCRDLVGNQQTTITSSTSETTIVTAGSSGVFRDLTSLAITNSSASALIVTLKDSTGGTTRGIYAIAANGGIVLTFPTPKTQSSSAQNWTLTCGSSVASIYVVAEYVNNI